MNSLLNGKVVVVTGGAGLLGRAFCHAITANGAMVVVADKDPEKALRCKEEIELVAHAEAAWVEMDITSQASIARAIDTVALAHGAIDAIVNNAYPRNARYGRKMEDVTYDDFCDNVGMHLGGYFLASQQFAAFFQRQGHGNIVNMSSIYGLIAPRFGLYDGTAMTMPVEYAAIKAGVLHLTRYFAQYLKGSGIRVNAISPGGIFDSQPQAFLDKYNALCSSKGMLDKSDVAGTLLFLLSDASASINGQNIVVDDGFTL